MRIKEIHIDHYGIYQNHSIVNLPAGLVVLVGQNESGKTTLMEFMRSILFGFLKNSGASQSGKLLIEARDGKAYLISRSGKSVLVTDDTGQVFPFEPAVQWLSGLDRSTYQKVFAVGLDDLQGLKLLAENTVRSRFFAAGAGGAVLVDSIRKVDDQLGDLLIAAAQGKKQINKLLKDQEAINAKSREARKDEVLYAALVEKRAGLINEIQKEMARLQTINSRLTTLAQLEQAWEPWTKLQLEKEKEAQVSFCGQFPANGLLRLEQLLRQRQDYLQEVQDKTDRHQKVTGQLAALTVDNAILSLESDIERLYGEKGRFAIESKQQPLTAAEQQSLHEQYERALREIGPEWNDAMLDEVDISVAVRQKVQSFIALFHQAAQKVSQAQSTEKQAAQALEELDKEVGRQQLLLDTTPVPGVASAAEMELLEEGLRITRSQLIKGQHIALTRKSALQAAADVDNQLAALVKGRMLQQPPLPGWLGPVIGLGCLAGAIFLWPASAAAAMLTALAGLTVAFVVRRQQRLQVKERRAWAQHVSAEEVRLQQQKAKLVRSIAELDEQGQLCEERLERATNEMGLGKPDTIEEADELEKQVATIRKAFEGWSLLNGRLAELTVKQKAAALMAAASRRDSEECLHEQQAVTSEWQTWLKDRYFSPDSSPGAFEIVLKAVENARELRRQYCQLAARAAAAAEYLAKVQAEFIRIMEKAGRYSGGMPTIYELETLYQELAAARTLAKEKSHLQEAVNEVQISLNRSLSQADLIQVELTELLAQAGAANEEEFRQLAEQHAQWLACRDSIEKLTTALRVVAGTAAKQASLEAVLAGTDILEVLQEKEMLHREKAVLEEAAAQKPQEIGAIDIQLKQLGQDDKMNVILAEKNIVASQLNSSSKQWAKLALCRHLLDQARSIYEQERQPSVILQADKFLRIMTNNRYQMLSAIGGSDVQLLDSARNSKGEPAWSSGLGDQVYLAIRLGLALEFGRLIEPLPLILDDILVRFDAVRQRGAAKVLLEVAKTQQVFLFSCHEHTRQVIQAVHACTEDTLTPVTYYDVNNGTVCPNLT